MSDKASIPGILAAMCEGISMRKACVASDVPPSTFIGWVETEPGLAEQYARARDQMLDVQAEALEEIGDKAAAAETAVEVAGLKLKSDNRKWLLSKLAPKKYGDRLTSELVGEGGGPVRITATSQDEAL